MSVVPDLNNPVGLLLAEISRLLRRDFAQLAQHLGLTQAQWRVLVYLSRNEGRSQAALADILEIQPISLARLLDRMVSSGWIERRPCPTDRRAYQLYLTPASTPVMQQIGEIGAVTRERALAGLDAQQRELLTDLLMQVKSNLQGIGASAPVSIVALPEFSTDGDGDVIVADIVV